MGRNKLLSALSGLFICLSALPAAAQDYAAPFIMGPTREFSVPQAHLLSEGTGIVSTSVLMNSPLGQAPITANATSLRSSMGMANNFQLDTGLSLLGGPWGGQLALSGKWGLLQENEGALFSLAGLAGGVLSADVNGNPMLAMQIGVPLSKTFAFNDVNALGISFFPAYNIGILQPRALAPVGILVSPANFISLGLGADYSLTSNLRVLADSNLGLNGVVGTLTQTNIGVRYALTPSVTTDLFLGYNQANNFNFRRPPASLGISAHFGF